MARFRATTNYQRRVEATGKRTGVNILSQDVPVQDNGFEDPDAFFTQPVAQPTDKENPAGKSKVARFSLGSLHPADDATAASGSSATSTTTGGATKRMMRRAKGSASPSELSRVSTASASPPRKKSPQGEASPAPIPEEENDPQEEVAWQALAEATEEELPVPDDNDEEDEDQDDPLHPRDDETANDASLMEDDFMPPGPPDSPQPDDESEMNTQVTNSLDFPTHPSADEESEDDDDGGMDYGFNMPSSKTPESAKMVHTEKTDPKKKKDGKKRKTVTLTESSDDEAEPKMKRKTKATKKNKYATTFSPKGIQLPYEYETLPVDEFRHVEQAEKDGKPCRRSKRARCKPLAYWKNEKMQYGPNDDSNVTADIANMPVPKAVIKAKETPYKPRVVRPRPVTADGKKKTKGVPAATTLPSPVAFDSSRIRKKYEYIDEEEAVMWEDAADEAVEMKLVAYRDRVQYHKLPLGKSRTKAEGNVVGKAAQAFNFVQPPDSEYVGYIMGNLALPPKGIKDAESVGSCAQTFTVVSGQPGAVEVAYAHPDEEDNGTLKPESAIRFLLGPGDMFRVPPGNCYRLQNHSKTTECFMTWTIIRPHVHHEP